MSTDKRADTDGAAEGLGEAGRRGDKVRGDIHVTFTARQSGAIELELTSKVEPYYGDAIRAQVRELLQAFGVEHGALQLVDSGALPFVIDARIAAALQAAGVQLPDDAGAMPARAASDRDRLRRSRLYLPGNEPKFMINAHLHGPDGVILDLEDSVHPRHKDAARALVARALRAVDFGAAERMVRINQLPLGLADLQQIVPAAPDLILIPKVEEVEQVLAVEREIEAIQRRDDEQRPLWLMPILESALGVENAFAVASASPRVVALTIGLEDYTADLGVPKTATGEETLWARSRLVNAARAAGCQAIDSVYGNVGDSEGLARWARDARALGFEGMGCVHPRQIPVIHEAFAPAPAEIDRAMRIVAAFEEAQAAGLGVVSLGSKMVDPPVVNRALKLVAQARAMGRCPAPEES